MKILTSKNTSPQKSSSFNNVREKSQIVYVREDITNSQKIT
jgi:hypothetical protein